MSLPQLVLFADRHYDAFPGRTQAALLRPLCDLTYIEEDYPALITALEARPRAIFAVNAIAGTPGNLTLPPELESPLHARLAAGAPLWVLHGGSAAFWPWVWWRRLMPLRWVRNGDPDGVPASTHPVVPLRLTPTTFARERLPGLAEVALPTDENYIKLAEHYPFETWLTTSHEGVVYPQAYSAVTPWGGALHGFIPGHTPDALAHPDYAKTFTTLATYWLKAQTGS